MRVDVRTEALSCGFVNEPVGTHTSRTIMLKELRGLLEAVGPSGDYAAHVHAAIELNAVRKSTQSTRKETLRRLRELYSLSPGVAVFSGLRALWDEDVEAQPLLAAMCAVARDPVFRSTLDVVLALDIEQTISPHALAAEVGESFPGRYSENVVAGTGRRIASSWQQAGLLSGRAVKLRRQTCARPTNVAYALYLGHLCGARGELLFSTPWARMLDRSIPELRTLVSVAARQGWLEYRAAGGVTEVTFRHLQGRTAGEQA